MQAALETLRSEAASQALASHHHVFQQSELDAISKIVGFWKVLSKHCELSQIKNFMYDCCTILALFSHFMPLCVPSGGLPGRGWKGLVRTERLHCSAAPRLEHKPIGGLQHCNGWTAGRFWLLLSCLPAKWCEQRLRFFGAVVNEGMISASFVMKPDRLC